MAAIRNLSVIILAVSLFPATATAAPKNSDRNAASKERTPKVSEAMGEKLQQALVAAKVKLGQLEPWQQKIFDEEAVPQYQRFIRDYRASATGLETEIDLDSLRRYLKFYAPKSLKRASAPIVVALKAESSCSRCQEVRSQIEKLVKERLDRRGLLPIMMAGADLNESSGKSLEEKASQLAQQKKAVGSLVLQWGIAPAEDADSAHADEVTYLIRSVLQIRDVARQESQLELLESGSLDHSAAKLLTDAFTELGDKVERMEIAHSELSRGEIALEVSGLTGGYSVYQSLRDQIQASLKELGPVVEQRLSRGHAVLVVSSDATPEVVQAKLREVRVQGLKFNITSAAGSQTIKMDVTP